MPVHKTAIALMIFLGFALSSCTLDSWVRIDGGEYRAYRSEGDGWQEAANAVQSLKIDRQAETAVFMFADGSQIKTAFVARDKSNWPSGCPTNISSTRMEVLDLDTKTLALGSLRLNDPILVRDCPRDPLEVVLREDGTIGGGGSACSGANGCLRFTPK